jgi:ABC-type uncharacterized transport system permease subunit
MMVPFFIGALILFIVPIQVIITANPKLEDTYNGYKIEVEQNTIRALAFLNGKVIMNRVQIFENIKSTFIGLFMSDTVYNINDSEITLNSAYQLATASNDTF